MTDDSTPVVSRRAMIVGGVCAAASVIANSRRPDEPLRMAPANADLNKLIPKKIGNWTFESVGGLVLPPEDQLKGGVYSKLLTRYYGAPDSEPIMLLIAYSGQQDGMLQVHRPEVCYPAAGYQLDENYIKPIDMGGGLTVPTHFIAARSNTRHEQMIYWTRIGNAFPERWYQQHLAVAEENLKGRVPDGVLVRISTAAPTDDRAIMLLDRFVASLQSQLSPVARRILFGDAGVKKA
ncbi:exosortase-associated protein EpsI, V-type [Sphingomonas montanisoli]|uniref:EpsI family protein n=1 Tax=Sphingomonas montanisoli TaxID=2606412 RepID=A0A5D9C9E6_9SPHN|nr:exosortase-associated protein EpsI, V-type [Sphingomonas montanisoli]TZG28026.1 EpsI family protein [Sphingomonas montanisoli]